MSPILESNEDFAVSLAVNAIRQARLGEPADLTSWGPCTDEDVRRAHVLVQAIRRCWWEELHGEPVNARAYAAVNSESRQLGEAARDALDDWSLP